MKLFNLVAGMVYRMSHVPNVGRVKLLNSTFDLSLEFNSIELNKPWAFTCIRDGRAGMLGML